METEQRAWLRLPLLLSTAVRGTLAYTLSGQGELLLSTYVEAIRLLFLPSLAVCTETF